MSDLYNKLKQCGRPTSEDGKKLAERMNEHHYPLTSWGLEVVQVSNSDIILDIGCGGGRTIATLAEKAPGGKVFGIDHSPDCVKWSEEYNQPLVDKGRVEVFHAAVEKMPFHGDFFDLIVGVETIYFWPDILDNFKEVHRILKSGGKFLVVNEMYLNEVFREKNEEHMATEKMTIYSPEQLDQLLKDAGFSEISIDLVESKNWLRCLAFAM